MSTRERSGDTGKVSVVDLKAEKKNYSCILSDGEKLELSVETVSEFSLYQGKELSENLLDRIRRYQNLQKTVQKGRRILSTKPFSKDEMASKLKNYEQVGKALDQLEEEGLIDDDSLAKLLAEEYSEKGFSAFGIQQELRRRKLDPESISKALEGLDTNQDSVKQIALKALKSGSGKESLAKLKQRAIRALSRKGFSLSECSRIVDDAVSELGETLGESRERDALIDNLRELRTNLEKTLQDSFALRIKLRAKLISRGFDPGMVDSVMDEEGVGR